MCSVTRLPIPGRRCFRRSSGACTDPDLTLVAYGGMLDIVERVAVCARGRRSDGGDRCARRFSSLCPGTRCSTC